MAWRRWASLGNCWVSDVNGWQLERLAFGKLCQNWNICFGQFSLEGSKDPKSP